MNILLQSSAGDVGDWLDALALALPEAAIAVWPDASADPDYALVWKPPPELLARVGSAKAIFNLGAGVDRLLAMPALPVGIPVVRLEDAGMAIQMAEYVTLAVLRAYREADAYAAQQREGVWRPRPRISKSAFTVGILGFGVLGQAVAAALAAFGFPLAVWSRSRKSRAEIASFAGPAELSAFLARSQALVCLLPSTAATLHLLDQRTLHMLPRGSHLINVGRGSVLVDNDLVALLDSGHLASATLDVFDREPLPDGHPFWHHPRITMTPHISAMTLVTDSVAQVAAKIRALERGMPVTGIVDRAHGY